MSATYPPGTEFNERGQVTYLPMSRNRWARLQEMGDGGGPQVAVRPRTGTGGGYDIGRATHMNDLQVRRKDSAARTRASRAAKAAGIAPTRKSVNKG